MLDSWKLFTSFSAFVFFGVIHLHSEQQAVDSVQLADESLKQSEEASLSWLSLIDQERYEESWQIGSQTLKLKVPSKHWVSLMKQIRQPFGSLKLRQLLDIRKAKDPKGLPKGDYMVIIYSSSFTNKPSAHELVTLVKERDGVWRVLTYQIQ